MPIATCQGAKWSFQVMPSAGGRYCVLGVDDAGISDVVERVGFQHQEVALAYALATAALDHYLNAVNLQSDACEEFERWQCLEEQFEIAALRFNDAPVAVVSGLVH